MRVAVLGCGPAGLMAAHAATIQGHDVKIFSELRKSEMFGAMYLHKPIPGISPEEPEFIVDVIKTGTAQGYSKNVYGHEDAPSSWNNIERGPNPAWNLALAYNLLWDLYRDRIEDMIVEPAILGEIKAAHGVVFSTIPLKALCTDPDHIFAAKQIWVIHGPAEPHHAALGSMMYYNGYTLTEGGFEWYRYSLINGYAAWEFSHERTKLHAWKNQRVSTGQKPLGTSCTCAYGIIRLGRFGTWSKNVLSHHAFERAMEHLDAL